MTVLKRDPDFGVGSYRDRLASILLGRRRSAGESAKKAFLLGHSHIGAVRLHLQDGCDSSRGGEKVDLHLFNIFGNAEYPFHQTTADGPLCNPALVSSIERERGSRRAAYFAIFGGNVHLALSMVQLPRSFDFIMGDPLNSERIEGAELVTKAYVKAVLRLWNERYIGDLIALRRAVGDDVYYLESPPPIGDNEHIRRHLDHYFQQNFPGQPISHPSLRYKMWRLQAELFKEICAENDIGFLGAPVKAVGPDGFLRPEYYSDDGTHGNKAYGHLVVERMEGVCGGALRRWGLFQ